MDCVRLAINLLIGIAMRGFHASLKEPAQVLVRTLHAGRPNNKLEKLLACYPGTTYRCVQQKIS